MLDRNFQGTGARRDWPKFSHVSLAIGSAIWFFQLIRSGVSPLESSWAVTLLLFSPLVLIPILLSLLRIEQWPTQTGRFFWWINRLQGPAAWLLLPACVLPQGTQSAALTLPWLVVTLLIAACGIERIRSRGRHQSAELCLDMGLIYVTVGSIWLFLWRLGRWPLGYKEVIAMLTAIHFHYAGILLPALTAFAARRRPSRLATVTCYGVIVGIPLTAVGITTTHLGFSPVLECAIVWLLSIAAIAAAWIQLSVAIRTDVPLLSRVLMIISSASLAGAMVLAALYGMRDLGGPAWLDIPWMRALHGTANAFGTAFCGLLGWCHLDCLAATQRGAGTLIDVKCSNPE